MQGVWLSKMNGETCIKATTCTSGIQTYSDVLLARAFKLKFSTLWYCQKTQSHTNIARQRGANNKMFISQLSHPENTTPYIIYFFLVQWDQYNITMYDVYNIEPSKCMISLTVGCMVQKLHTHILNICNLHSYQKTSRQAWTYRRKLFNGNVGGSILRLFTIFCSFWSCFVAFWFGEKRACEGGLVPSIWSSMSCGEQWSLVTSWGEFCNDPKGSLIT